MDDSRILPREEIAEQLKIFLDLQRRAISIVEKYINKFENDLEYKPVAEDLKHGKWVLETGYERDLKEGVDGIIADVKRFPKHAPGIGLSRGFGEFLYAIGEDWIHEIMDAVHAIEDYYAILGRVPPPPRPPAFTPSTPHGSFSWKDKG